MLLPLAGADAPADALNLVGVPTMLTRGKLLLAKRKRERHESNWPLVWKDEEATL